MNMSPPENLRNRVKVARQARGWSQDELSRRSGLSRSGVSAIEIERLVPSAAAALALAKAFDCRVEDLFSLDVPAGPLVAWAVSPPARRSRYWQAEFDGQIVSYAADAFGEVACAHDGIVDRGVLHPAPQSDPRQTLVMACCDPAVGLLADELVRRAQIRLVVIERSSSQALDLLARRLVHVAGLHLSRASGDGNFAAARATLGDRDPFSLLRVARWEEGLAIAPARRLRTVRAALAARLRWIGREAGSGAQQCLAEIRGNRQTPRHHTTSHRGVAEAVRAGLVDTGICLRLASAQAGLDFLSVREEAYDLCFSGKDAHDPRIQALVEVIRSTGYRKLLGELPGYSTADAGNIRSLPVRG
jgi:molybdate-binding protein/transcriptional regulator with XRE-family HTH domain